jgi:hypothetical protein
MCLYLQLTVCVRMPRAGQCEGSLGKVRDVFALTDRHISDHSKGMLSKQHELDLAMWRVRMYPFPLCLRYRRCGHKDFTVLALIPLCPSPSSLLRQERLPLNLPPVGLRTAMEL